MSSRPAHRSAAQHVESVNTKRKQLAIAIAVTLAFTETAAAQTAQWVGGTSSDLSNAANWQAGTLPTTSSTATFSGAIASPLTLENDQLSIKGLIFEPGVAATTLTLSSSGALPASLSVGAGGISNLSTTPQNILLGSANSSLNLSGAGSSITGPVTISNSTLLTQTTFLAGASAGSSVITNSQGGVTEFNDASAGTAAISVGDISKVLFLAGSTGGKGGLTISALGSVAFDDTSSAANAQINNAGSLVFAGTSTAAASTITNAGQLLVSNAASLGQATISSTGSLNLSGTSTAASSSITNAGVAVFSDSSTAAQSTIANLTGASLSFSSTSSAGTSKITNAGTLTFEDASSGGASLITNDAGATVVFSGTPSATTSHLINAGTVNVAAVTGSLAIGSLSGAGAVVLGATRLTLGGLGLSDQLSGTVSGSGGITKTGAGTLTLAGTSSFSGDTEVEGGTLQLNGTLASAINVSASAALAGSGTTTSSVQIARAGSLAPGATNTLRIDGNLTLSPGAVLLTNVTPAGAASHVAVGGSASISGATLQIGASGVAANYAPATTYTVLSANLGVSGTFLQATSNLALLAPKLTYQPDAVLLSFAQLSVPGSGAGLGLNPQLPLASTTSGSSTGTLVANLDTLTTAELDTEVGDLGASTYSALRQLNLNESDQFAREVAAHNFSVESGYGANSATGWLDYQARRTSTDGSFGTLHDRDEGLIGGSDVYSDGTMRLAIAGQLLHSAIDLGGGNNATSDRYDIGLIGSFRNEPFLFTGLGAIGQHTDNVNRFIDFANYIEGPSSHPSGFNAELYGEAGAEIDEGPRTWMPYFALDGVMASDDSFQEGGGAAADLLGRARRANLLTSSLGVRVVQPISNNWIGLGPDNQNWLTGSLAWLHDNGSTDGRVDASFLSDVSHSLFASTAPAFARDRILASAEIHAEWQHQWQLEARIVGEGGQGSRSLEGYTGLSYVW